MEAQAGAWYLFLVDDIVMLLGSPMLPPYKPGNRHLRLLRMWL